MDKVNALMAWIMARARENSTYSGLAYIGLALALASALFGLDVEAMLDQAQANTTKLVAIVGLGTTAVAGLARIIKPDQQARAVEIEPAELLPMQTYPGLAAAIAEDVARRLAGSIKP